jgi:transposase InsO family protein
MSDDPPPISLIPAHIRALPFPVRLGLWMAYGTALGIPVDAVFRVVNAMLAAAKRQLAGKRLRMTTAERLRAARHLAKIPVAVRELFQWIVSPDSLIRWLKRYQQRKANGDGKTKPKQPGRPWIKPEKVAAILRIYDAGLTGLSRIVGEMVKCGLPVVESTVRRVLTAHGRPPTDHNHRRGSTWAQFWNNHAPFTIGADFIQMPIGLLGKVVNAFVFCAIEHDTRQVHLLGITTNPTDAWVANVLRSATMLGGPLADRRHVILDNDGKYGEQTIAVLGKRLVWTSIEAPDMNAFIERWNRSAQEECLDHVVFLSEAHLRHYVEAYIRHHNTERPHQGIGNVPIGPWTVGTGKIVCDTSLNGLLTSFRRAA